MSVSVSVSELSLVRLDWTMDLDFGGQKIIVEISSSVFYLE